MELERRGVQDLSSTIDAAESLIELKRDTSKGRSKKGHKDSDSKENRDNSPKRDRPPRDKDNRIFKLVKLNVQIYKYSSHKYSTSYNRIFKYFKKTSMNGEIF